MTEDNNYTVHDLMFCTTMILESVTLKIDAVSQDIFRSNNLCVGRKRNHSISCELTKHEV